MADLSGAAALESTATTGAEEQDSPPAIVVGDEQPKPDRGFADHPDWQKMIGQRNEARTQADEASKQLVELQGKLAEFEKKPDSIVELTEAEESILERSYPKLRDRIFKEAQELEAKRLESEGKQKKQQEEQDAQLQVEAQKLIDEVRSEFPDDKSWDTFTEFLGTTIKRYPNATLDAAFEDYKDRGLMPLKGEKVSQGTGGEAPQGDLPATSKKESFVSAGVRGLRAKGK